MTGRFRGALFSFVCVCGESKKPSPSANTVYGPMWVTVGNAPRYTGPYEKVFRFPRWEIF